MSLVMAVFLLVVLAALGAFIVSMSAVQQADSALDLQGSRTYQAARSGIEYGAYQATVGVCAGAITLAVPTDNLGTTMPVTVRCNSTAHTEGLNGAKNLYVIVANACNQPNGGNCPNTVAPGANYVERELQASVFN